MTGPTGVRTCPACGEEGSGRFCAQCGTPLGGAPCPRCGSPLRAGALYCSECGQAVSSRPAKTAGSRLPWILSFVALAAFSVIIALLVQRQAAPRIGDQVMTGGIGGEAGTTGGMPTAAELEAMGPRAAADRLFERAMREHEGGDFERAARFLAMGLQAYESVPPGDLDADARFHMGILQLMSGDSVAARRTAEEILATEPDHLLGFILAARVADFRQDSADARKNRDRLRQVVERGGVPDRPEYEAHRPMIDREMETSGS